MTGFVDAVSRVGARMLHVLHTFGHAAFFFVDLLRALPASLRRFWLVVVQVHAIGNLSLLIILASGLAVGFVLALQMYYALVRYGATESLGLIVNLSLVRELGPVVTALLFAGVIAMPVLAVLFSAIGILGAWLVAVGLIGLDAGNFWSTMQNGVDVWDDVGNGLVKAFFFGIICTAVALYQGYDAHRRDLVTGGAGDGLHPHGADVLHAMTRHRIAKHG